MWSGSERGPGGRKPHKDGGGMMKVGGSRQSNGNMHKKKVTLHRFSGDGLKKDSESDEANEPSASRKISWRWHDVVNCFSKHRCVQHSQSLCHFKLMFARFNCSVRGWPSSLPLIHCRRFLTQYRRKAAEPFLKRTSLLEKTKWSHIDLDDQYLSGAPPQWQTWRSSETVEFNLMMSLVTAGTPNKTERSFNRFSAPACSWGS